MRVIFLDFDGVLNTYVYLFLVDPDSDDTDASALDPKAIARLNRIVEKTDSVVVLSTFWRHLHTQKNIVRMLDQRGFCGQVVGHTPFIDETQPTVMREVEVQRWLAMQRDAVESFVVLDDLDEFPSIKERHIRTDPNKGLTDQHIDEAVTILRTPIRNAA